jgi:hypothetical protein
MGSHLSWQLLYYVSTVTYGAAYWVVPSFLVLIGVISAFDTFIYTGFCILVDLVLGGSELGWFCL